MIDNTIKKIDNYTYYTKDTIGSGSYGKVFKGLDTLTGNIVAIKQIDRNVLSQDQYLVQGFQSEVSIMKKLKGKNIVGLIDVLETSNNYYVIQEFCESGDLLKVLKNNRGGLGEQQSKDILVQILTGFQELLKQGIIHRDLKPDNILIKEGVYKIADFGFSKIVQNFNTQMLQSLVGTPLYMSPQILKQERYSTKCDIWSLAFVYYETIFGCTPWIGTSQYQLLQNIYNKPLEFPGNVTLSEDSKDFLRKCLKPEENDRISWDDLYQHPLVSQYFQTSLQQNTHIENTALYAINNVRQTILSKNINFDEIFQESNFKQQTKLQFQDFYNLLLKIDSTFFKDEIILLFKHFDKNKSQIIEFSVFYTWLVESNVKLSKQPTLQPPNKLTLQNTQNVELNSLQLTIVQNQNYESMLESNHLVTYNSAIILIGQAVLKYNLQIGDLYKKYDKSGRQQMKIADLNSLVTKVGNFTQPGDIISAFENIDVQKKGYITLEEFTFAINSSMEKNKNIENPKKKKKESIIQNQMPQQMSSPQIQIIQPQQVYVQQNNQGNMNDSQKLQQQQPYVSTPSPTIINYQGNNSQNLQQQQPYTTSSPTLINYQSHNQENMYNSQEYQVGQNLINQQSQSPQYQPINQGNINNSQDLQQYQQIPNQQGSQYQVGQHLINQQYQQQPLYQPINQGNINNSQNSQQYQQTPNQQGLQYQVGQHLINQQYQQQPQYQPINQGNINNQQQYQQIPNQQGNLQYQVGQTSINQYQQQTQYQVPNQITGSPSGYKQ